MQLSHWQKTVSKLYNCDASGKICKLKEDGQMTKRFKSIFYEEIEREVLWKLLVVILINDLRIHNKNIYH